jgi:hypothetical protein
MDPGAYEYVNQNYNSFRRELSAYCRKSGLVFDEDVFHDTLIARVEKVNDLKKFKNYLFVAFKTNILREKNYSRNAMRSELPEQWDKMTDNTEASVIWSQLKEQLEKKFGKELIEMFVEHMNGSSIRELELEYNIKGLNY